MTEPQSASESESLDPMAVEYDFRLELPTEAEAIGDKPTRRSTREGSKIGRKRLVNISAEDHGSSKASTTRHSTRLFTGGSAAGMPKEEKESKKIVTVKPSLAPVQELGNSYPDWSVLERELELSKTLENAYFLDSSFLRAMSVLNLWLGAEGPFFMPRREFRHRHAIFVLFWQPSAPNWEKSDYIVPARLNGLLRWYLTRDNFINKESGNRLQDITDRLPSEAQTALTARGWSLYIMNMVHSTGNQLIFRKDNEVEYQPFFGSTAKSQLRNTVLPELSADSFEALCHRLTPPDLHQRIAALPDLTLGPIAPHVLASVRSDLDAYRTGELVNLRRIGASKPTSFHVAAARKKKLEATTVAQQAVETTSTAGVSDEEGHQQLIARPEGPGVGARNSPGTYDGGYGRMEIVLGELKEKSGMQSGSYMASGAPSHTRHGHLAASGQSTPVSIAPSSMAQHSSRAGRNTTRAMHNLQQQLQEETDASSYHYSTHAHQDVYHAATATSSAYLGNNPAPPRSASPALNLSRSGAVSSSVHATPASASTGLLYEMDATNSKSESVMDVDEAEMGGPFDAKNVHPSPAQASTRIKSEFDNAPAHSHATTSSPPTGYASHSPTTRPYSLKLTTKGRGARVGVATSVPLAPSHDSSTSHSSRSTPNPAAEAPRDPSGPDETFDYSNNPALTLTETTPGARHKRTAGAAFEHDPSSGTVSTGAKSAQATNKRRKLTSSTVGKSSSVDSSATHSASAPPSHLPNRTSNASPGNMATYSPLPTPSASATPSSSLHRPLVSLATPHDVHRLELLTSTSLQSLHQSFATCFRKLASAVSLSSYMHYPSQSPSLSSSDISLMADRISRSFNAIDALRAEYDMISSICEHATTLPPTHLSTHDSLPSSHRSQVGVHPLPQLPTGPWNMGGLGTGNATFPTFDLMPAPALHHTSPSGRIATSSSTSQGQGPALGPPSNATQVSNSGSILAGSASTPASPFSVPTNPATGHGSVAPAQRPLAQSTPNLESDANARLSPVDPIMLTGPSTKSSTHQLPSHQPRHQQGPLSTSNQQQQHHHNHHHHHQHQQHQQQMHFLHTAPPSLTSRNSLPSKISGDVGMGATGGSAIGQTDVQMETSSGHGSQSRTSQPPSDGASSTSTVAAGGNPGERVDQATMHTSSAASSSYSHSESHQHSGRFSYDFQSTSPFFIPHTPSFLHPGNHVSLAPPAAMTNQLGLPAPPPHHALPHPYAPTDPTAMNAPYLYSPVTPEQGLYNAGNATAPPLPFHMIGYPPSPLHEPTSPSTQEYMKKSPYF